MKRSPLTGEKVSTLEYFAHLMEHYQAGHPKAFKQLTEYVDMVSDDTGCPQLAKQAKYRSACCYCLVHAGCIPH